MAGLKRKCPYCGKTGQELKRSTSIPGKVLITYECGHTVTKTHQEVKAEEQVVSRLGKVAYPFQMASVAASEKNNFSFIHGHEQGLGKTGIGAINVKLHMQELTPCLVVCKSGLRINMWKEFYDWTGLVAQVIDSGRSKPMFDVFPIIIVSFDMLRLLRPDFEEEWRRVQKAVIAEATGRKHKERKVIWTDAICAQFKHCIIDECQMVKNSDASRTKALRKILFAAGADCSVEGLSGTPVENNAGEFFPILNLVAPEMFPSEAGYLSRDCKIDEYGKVRGLKNPEQFHHKIKHMYLRYKRADVLPDLPPIRRGVQFGKLEGGELEAYKKIVTEFQDYMEDLDAQGKQAGFAEFTNILAYLAKMRHLTGIAKVESAVDFTTEFLLSTDRKLTIFVHHKEVANQILIKLGDWCAAGGFAPPLQLRGGMDVSLKEQVVQDFWKPGNRILVASLLAAAEGINLQCCSDALIVEREWNPAKEEQAEGRFPRPGQTADKIAITYLIKEGTVDDFLTELIEDKRIAKDETLDGTVSDEVLERGMVMALARRLQERGLAKWKVA